MNNKKRHKYLIKICGETEFDNIVSKEDKLQDLNLNQLKLEVHNTYKKDEKITTIFEATDDSDVMNKAYLDKTLLNMNEYLSEVGKNYIEFILKYNKQSVEKF